MITPQVSSWRARAVWLAALAASACGGHAEGALDASTGDHDDARGDASAPDALASTPDALADAAAPDAMPPAIDCAHATPANPHAIATVPDDPFNQFSKLAVADGYVYWGFQEPPPVGAAHVFRAPIAGGPTETLFSDAAGNIQDLAVSGGQVIWANGSIWGGPVTGGVAPTLILSSGYVEDVAVADDAIYYADATGWIGRLARQPGATPTKVAPNIHPGRGVRLDGGLVYFNDTWGQPTVTIERVPSGGGNAQRLAAGQDWPSDYAVSGHELYWVNAGDRSRGVMGALRRSPIGAAVPRVLQRGALYSVTFARDAGAVYVASANAQGYLDRYDPSTRKLTTLVQAKDRHLGAMAFDDTYIYVLDDGLEIPPMPPYPPVEVPGALLRVPRAGGAAEVLVDQRRYPRAMVMDADAVYWAETGTGEMNWTDGAIVRWDKHTGAVTVLADHELDPAFLVTDGTTLFWGSYYGGTVRAMPTTGGAPANVVSGLGRVSGLALDGGVLYVTDDVAGIVLRVAAAGGAPPITLASSQPRASHVIVDGAYVYWSSYGGLDREGRVMRVPTAGGAPEVVLDGLDWPGHLLIDGDSIYVNDENAGDVLLSPSKAASPIETLAVEDTPYEVRVDATHVYYASFDGLSRIPLAGGPRELLRPAGWFALDDANVYFNLRDGIYCFAK